MCGETQGIRCSNQRGCAKVFALSRAELPREENVNRARCGNGACLQLHLSSADTCSMQPAKAVEEVREVCGRRRGQRQCSHCNSACIHTMRFHLFAARSNSSITSEDCLRLSTYLRF